MHFAFGYVAVSLTWKVGRRQMDATVVVAIVVGTQFPDIVDKPLAWYLGVLPAGRSLTHSVFTATAISCLVIAIAIYQGHFHSGLAFVVAYATHLLGDALPGLSTGDYQALTFLFWPILSLPKYEGATPVIGALSEILASPWAYLLASPLRMATVAAVAILWILDGFPGAVEVGRYLFDSVHARTE